MAARLTLNVVDDATALQGIQFPELQRLDAAPYFLPEWHVALQRGAPGSRVPCHVVVTDGHGIAAAALGYIVTGCPKLAIYTEQFAGTTQPWSPDARVFQCQSSYAPVSTIAMRPDTPPDVMDWVLTTMESLAEENDCPAVLFMNVDARDGLLREQLTGRGYISTYVNCNNVLELNFDSLDDYVSTRSRKFRRNLRYYQRNWATKEIEVRAMGLSDLDIARHEALVAGPCLLHGNAGLHYPAWYLRQIRECLGDHLMVLSAAIPSRGEISSLWVLQCAGSMHAWIGGIEYSFLRSHEPYHLHYVDLIQRGIREGVRILHFGRGTFSVKARYGCTLVPLYLFVKPLRPAARATIAAWVSTIQSWAVGYFRKQMGADPPFSLRG